MSIRIGPDGTIIKDDSQQPQTVPTYTPPTTRQVPSPRIPVQHATNYLSDYELRMTDLLHSNFSAAKEQLESDHAFGNLTATYLLGKIYFDRIFIAPDYEKAMSYWEHGASLGDLNCKRSLGDCYYYGRGREENNAKALEIYNSVLAINPQEYVAMYMLARMIVNGHGVRKDVQRALSLFEQAWNGGYYRAAGEIGEIYQFQYQKTREDIMNALKWYQRGAEKGDAWCCYRLGLFLTGGDYGVQIDEERGYGFLLRAMDYAQAINYLLLSIITADYQNFRSPVEVLTGDIINLIFSEAERRAEYGFTDLQMSLGDCYGDGKGRVQSSEKALYYYEKALANGEYQAAWRLGNNYKLGWQGFEIDLQKAFKYYRIGAEADDNNCLQSLEGLLSDEYIPGLQPGESEQMQRYCLERRAQQGDKHAIGTLGNSLMNGYRPFDEDKERAIQCFEQLAGNEGNDSFLDHNLDLALLYIELRKTNKYNQLIPCLQRAAQFHNTDYYKGWIDHTYGVIYRDALGVQKDLSKAHEYFLSAMEKGYEPAKEDLSHFKKGIFGWKLV